MTTAPVVSVTDKLIAELEQLYIAGWEASGEGWNAEYPGDAHEAKAFIERMRDACAPVAEKLLAERAELKRDAERYRWLREHHNDIHGSIWVSAFNREQYDWVSIDSWFLTGDSADDLNLDAAIDAAMQS